MYNRSYYVYIMTNRFGTLYVGVTNSRSAAWEHKTGMQRSFTKRYRMDRLVYCEETPSRMAAIERERQIKGWLRRKKVELIAETNPRWEDLAAAWYDEGPGSSPRSE